MFKHIAYGGVMVAAAVALSGLGAGGAGASATAAGAGQPAGQAAATAGQAAAVPGAQLWVQRYNGPDKGNNEARVVAVSPPGDRVFVTGSNAANGHSNCVTVAYDAATGAQLWVKRYGPGAAASLAVSPSGGAVFVTGTSDGGATSDDYATVAYNAATGAQLWAQRHNGPANGNDHATSVAVSPSGRTVFVTGSRTAANATPNYATVAYDAATGARLWVHAYNGPANRGDHAISLAVSPSRGAVFVTGYSRHATGADYARGGDYATVAYNAATGAQLWVQRYNGHANGDDRATSVAVGPSGDAVFVTGSRTAATGYADYATVAYNAATGAQLWVHGYNGPANRRDHALSLAASPSGGAVFVTGFSRGGDAEDYATVAYDAATGARLWLQRYNELGGWDGAYSVAVSPSGGTVYVTGRSEGDFDSVIDAATLAYDAATGAQLWVQRYNGPGVAYYDEAYSVAVSPSSGTVFVTGGSINSPGWEDYITIAYSG